MGIIQASPVVTSTGQLANQVVETADIKDANVTVAKIAPGADAEVLTTSGTSVVWSAPAGIPVGGVIPFAGSAAPTGFVLADGSSLLRAGTYATLFGVIGTTYGTVDGTHFTLPDLRQRVPVGKDAGTFNTLGGTGGAETHTLDTTQIPSHTHGLAEGFTAGSNQTQRGFSSISVSNTPMTATATGGGLSHNNLQPYIVLNYIVKY